MIVFWHYFSFYSLIFNFYFLILHVFSVLVVQFWLSFIFSSFCRVYNSVLCVILYFTEDVWVTNERLLKSFLLVIFVWHFFILIYITCYYCAFEYIRIFFFIKWHPEPEKSLKSVSETRSHPLPNSNNKTSIDQGCVK